EPVLDRAAARGQVAAPVAAHDPGIAGPVSDGGLDRREQHLRRQPALGERDRRDLLLEEARDEPRRLAEVRRPDAELGVDDGWVVAEEHLLARGRPALGDFLHALADQAL